MESYSVCAHEGGRAGGQGGAEETPTQQTAVACSAYYEQDHVASPLRLNRPQYRHSVFFYTKTQLNYCYSF